jgi:hypothetical protein
MWMLLMSLSVRLNYSLYINRAGVQAKRHAFLSSVQCRTSCCVQFNPEETAYILLDLRSRGSLLPYCPHRFPLIKLVVETNQLLSTGSAAKTARG